MASNQENATLLDALAGKLRAGPQDDWHRCLAAVFEFAAEDFQKDREGWLARAVLDLAHVYRREH